MSVISAAALRKTSLSLWVAFIFPTSITCFFLLFYLLPDKQITLPEKIPQAAKRKINLAIIYKQPQQSHKGESFHGKGEVFFLQGSILNNPVVISPLGFINILSLVLLLNTLFVWCRKQLFVCLVFVCLFFTWIKISWKWGFMQLSFQFKPNFCTFPSVWDCVR